MLEGLLHQQKGDDVTKVIEFPAQAQNWAQRPPLTRDEAIRRIRAGLKARSSREWSVTGGRGTAWGWITIDVLPRERVWVPEPRPGVDEHALISFEARMQWRRLTPEERAAGQMGYAGPEERALLSQLLGLDRLVHFQGEAVPDGHGYYEEYVNRAEGRQPTMRGQPYWD